MPSRPFLRAMLVGAGVALAALFVLLAWRHFTAEPEPARFDPGAFVSPRPKLDAPYVVTDYEVVDAMLALAEVRPDDFVVDLGSGDGRILIAAARSHGARGLGVDIDPARIREATANAGAAGVAHRVQFRRQDLFETPIAEADVVTLYLTPEVNLRLRPRILAEMRPGARVVSHDFDMGDWRPDQRQRIGSATIYLWRVPARLAGRWTLTVDGRPLNMELQQNYQQLRGAIAAGGRAVRVEQGQVAGDRVRFVADLPGGRRVFEGRAQGGGIEPLAPDAGWRAVRAAELGMPLALIGLVIAWAVVLLFGAMEFDRGLLLFFYAGDRPGLARVASWVTELGSGGVLLAATGFGAGILLYRRDWRNAALLVGITLSGRLLVELQKGWTARLRPDPHGHLVPVETFAFPSGHAANAALVWLGLALLVPRGPRASAFAVWAAVWLVLAVGATRAMLGVHWPSDVIGGWAFGLFWTLALLRLAGHPLDQGTPALPRHFPSPKESEDVRPHPPGRS